MRCGQLADLGPWACKLVPYKMALHDLVMLRLLNKFLVPKPPLCRGVRSQAGHGAKRATENNSWNTCIILAKIFHEVEKQLSVLEKNSLKYDRKNVIKLNDSFTLGAFFKIPLSTWFTMLFPYMMVGSNKILLRTADCRTEQVTWGATIGRIQFKFENSV